jgi:HlyD family secretion protein
VKKSRMQFVPIVIIVIVAAMGVYWFTTRAATQDQGLKASGTIEATDVSLSPEIGGRVIDVAATDGDAVTKDQALVRLDDTLLQAQLKQVEANVQALQAQQRAAQAQQQTARAQQQAAQANYDLLKSGPIVEQIDAAQQAVNTAIANVASAQAQYSQLKSGAQAADIAAAASAAAAAETQRKVAQDHYDKVTDCVTIKKPDGTKDNICPGLGTPEEEARAALNAANQAADAANARVDQIKRGATQDEINGAAARVNAAKAQQAMAQAQLEQVQKGARTEQLAAAQAQIDATKAQVDGAAAQIDGAAAQVEAAKAQANALQVQIDKLTLRSPLSGTVLKRNIEPGEVVAPGAALMTLGDTGNLYITVYVPEDRYGQIKVDQPVTVKVDSFPTENFTAKVTRIADQAEFTPRNVQTAEGRATTVFAVKLAVENAAGKLKPGMPADVYFEQ